jgi:hypothetical protein|tara:strand:+ start:1158 stop:1433 length:276 start_codon:yes stop_codon:yes gene_type:complete
MPRKKVRFWTDLEHTFLKECSKNGIPFNWVDIALGRPLRSSQSHARKTVEDIPPSKWKGPLSFQQKSRYRARFATICAKYQKKGLRIRRRP